MLGKKRTADPMAGHDSHLQTHTKKRSPLGEISNLSTIPTTKDLDTHPQKPKCKPEVKVTEQEVKDVQEIEANSDDTHVTDIYHYLRNMEKEEKRRPIQGYMEKVQKYVSANMRGVLVDWLVEVMEEYNLQPNTLFLAIGYIDKFLSSNAINKQKLQLLGVSSLLIASKLEGINPPTADDFSYMTDNTYRKEDVVKMEGDILECLGFEVSSPTPTVMTFLKRFARISEEDFEDPYSKFELLGCYLAELSLLDYECVKFLPSMIASSAIFLSRFIFHPDKHPWNANLQKYTGYKPADLKECVLIIQDWQLGNRGGSLIAIREKYISKFKFQYTWLMLCRLEIPSLFFEEMSVPDN